MQEQRDDIKLQVDLVETKQNRVHISQLEQTLREDASLLRESSTLEHVSHSKRGHASAARQVKQAAQLVKNTEAMLMESRSDAVEKSQVRQAMLDVMVGVYTRDGLCACERCVLVGT